MLIDVRTEEEYAGGHLEGAVNIPLGRLGEDEIKDIPKDEEIILYCLSGGRSEIAVQFFRNFGFSNVRHIEGGMQGL